MTPAREPLFDDLRMGLLVGIDRAIGLGPDLFLQLLALVGHAEHDTGQVLVDRPVSCSA